MDPKKFPDHKWKRVDIGTISSPEFGRRCLSTFGGFACILFAIVLVGDSWHLFKHIALFRWANIWTLCRPIQSWACTVEDNIVDGHVGGLEDVHNQPLDRRILDRKIPASDKPGVPERTKILEHVQKFLKMDIIKEGIPHKSVIQYCTEYDDVVRILGPDIHRNIPKTKRPSEGSLRFWVVRKLSETLSLYQIRKKLTDIHIPDVQVWWDTFIMCHPVYCVEARGEECERLTFISIPEF